MSSPGNIESSDIHSWYRLLRNMLNLLYLPNIGVVGRARAPPSERAKLHLHVYAMQGHTDTIIDGSVSNARIVV